MYLAMRLRELRELRGISRTELADITGISLSYITKLENGERQHMSDTMVQKFASAFDVPTVAFVPTTKSLIGELLVVKGQLLATQAQVAEYERKIEKIKAIVECL